MQQQQQQQQQQEEGGKYQEQQADQDATTGLLDRCIRDSTAGSRQQQQQQPQQQQQQQQIPDDIVEIEHALEHSSTRALEHSRTQEPKDTRGFIYIMRCDSAWEGWVKAGEAARVSERLRTYQTYSPHRDYVLVAAVYVANRGEAEKKLHEELEKHGQHDHEWFEVCIETAMAVIEEFREDFIEQ